MKALAIISVAPGVDMESVRSGLASELKESWTLFTSGVLREAYATAQATRVVFVLEVNDRTHAEQQLLRLPLIAAGTFAFELIELRPFVNWSMLFAK